MSGKDLPPSQRAVLMGAGGIALVFGVLGGLWRAGWDVPLPGTQPASFHGALMVAAFFGTLIGLEHAAAAGRRLAYLGPACAALGGLGTALGAPHPASAGLLLAGSLVLAALAFGNARRDPMPHALLMLTGACLGVAGNALWLAGLPASAATGPWLAFLVLTVVGERFELSHLRQPGGRALALLAAAALLLAGGALLAPWFWRAGAAAMGAALLGLSLWLLVHDVARRDLRHHRQARFTALCLVGGYLWLAAAGLMLPFAAVGDATYGAALHAVFLGFVVAAAIGHAGAILPGLIGVDAPYSAWFYLHLGLLEAALLLRVGADLAGLPAWSAWGGMGSAAALALFALLTAAGARHGRRRRTRIA
ncbi:MAG TPA: hypothetical protein VF816_11385 [Rhodocyclaceae bacterium]